ncbi:zinc-dependent metalloprotease [Arcanobacterium hippocoleae]|uniref:Uncharacterized protein (DUF2342 family) n=1 Tax=Arcanobacterium hippocoleae TaxID=149017 RepID=A0ABU1T3A0_9ACTO|nr:zinc-dependent metalloprotease [Arcanobacterium hippocoleae]MDR6939864.1 uncharacterized protein (DUF2342 family) [Arcanobacterium hippocoleae]
MDSSAQIAQSITRYLVSPGPNAARHEAAATVAELQLQAKRAPRFVAEITGLAQAAELAQQVPVFVLDRAKWASEVGRFTDSLIAWTGQQQVRRAGQVAIGSVLSFAATKVLGQFDPFADLLGQTILADASVDLAASVATKDAAHSGVSAKTESLDAAAKLMLVAPNIAKFRNEYDLDRRDLALWVSVHELTHAVQFIHAKWLRGYLLERMQCALSLGEADEDELLSAEIEKIQNVMSILEGHAQYVMNALPIAVLPSRDAIIKALAEKRKGSSWLQRKLTKVLGFERKIAQYRRGEDFTQYVVANAGMEVFNKIWEGAANLPDNDEFAQPQLWIERMKHTARIGSEA